MSGMLASDVNNPEFAGAIHPDSGLWVEFFVWEKKDKLDADGKKLTDNYGKPYCRMRNPGDKTLCVEQPVTQEHKDRFPQHWAIFQRMNGEEQIVGTPIEAWYEARRDEDLNEVQINELRILKFLTCEALATASDAQIQRLGMGGASLRIKCSEWLKSRGQSAANAELEALRAGQRNTEKQMEEMRQMLAAALAPKRPGRKPGSKNKPQVKAHGQQHALATGDAGNG
jgi:hypothetical protein